MPQMSAASFPVILGGRTFFMSPFTDKDVDEMTNWIRASVVQTARLALTPDMSQEERDEITSAAIAKASTMDYGDPSTIDWMNSRTGKERLMYQSLRARHPELSFEAFRKLLINPNEENGIGSYRYDRQAMDEMGRVWQEMNLSKKHRNAGGDKGGTAGQDSDEGTGLRQAGGDVPLHAGGDRGHDPLPATQPDLA